MNVLRRLFILDIRTLLVEGGDKLTSKMLKNVLFNQFYLFKSQKKLFKTKKNVIFSSGAILNNKYKFKSKIRSKLAKDNITIYKR
jgi:Pyrimidine reductase, riboflavin biosynthesis